MWSHLPFIFFFFAKWRIAKMKYIMSLWCIERISQRDVMRIPMGWKNPRRWESWTGKWETTRKREAKPCNINTASLGFASFNSLHLLSHWLSHASFEPIQPDLASNETKYILDLQIGWLKYLWWALIALGLYFEKEFKVPSKFAWGQVRSPPALCTRWTISVKFEQVTQIPFFGLFSWAEHKCLVNNSTLKQVRSGIPQVRLPPSTITLPTIIARGIKCRHKTVFVFTWKCIWGWVLCAKYRVLAVVVSLLLYSYIVSKFYCQKNRVDCTK